MPPAARLNDMHECPMVDPTALTPPHIGGPIVGPCSPSVMVEGIPAAQVGDSLFCVGSSDTIVKGSSSVMIEGRPAARLGDTTAHGGIITTGCSTVNIGD